MAFIAYMELPGLNANRDSDFIFFFKNRQTSLLISKSSKAPSAFAIATGPIFIFFCFQLFPKFISLFRKYFSNSAVNFRSKVTEASLIESISKISKSSFPCRSHSIYRFLGHIWCSDSSLFSSRWRLGRSLSEIKVFMLYSVFHEHIHLIDADFSAR